VSRDLYFWDTIAKCYDALFERDTEKHFFKEEQFAIFGEN